MSQVDGKCNPAPGEPLRSLSKALKVEELYGGWNFMADPAMYLIYRICCPAVMAKLVFLLPRWPHLEPAQWATSPP